MKLPAHSSVEIPLDGNLHVGDLSVPPASAGIVLFAHGSGSGRLSSRNQFVANALNREGIATLLFDLLTEQEDRDYQNRFDIELLARRLMDATECMRLQPQLRDMKIGYFGASTGAAAAIMAAVAHAKWIAAVVSRGGRPDLAFEYLSSVRAPTLFIVGGDDHDVLELNRQAYEELKAVKSLEIVPHATHLFEEPGTLEQVALLASAWFRKYLARTAVQH